MKSPRARGSAAVFLDRDGVLNRALVRGGKPYPPRTLGELEILPGVPDACDCRKPAPGLLLEAARDWDIDLAASVMVGDRWRDVESGKRAGCKTVFIDHGYSERRPDSPDLTVASLPEAVSWIL